MKFVKVDSRFFINIATIESIQFKEDNFTLYTTAISDGEQCYYKVRYDSEYFPALKREVIDLCDALRQQYEQIVNAAN